MKRKALLLVIIQLLAIELLYACNPPAPSGDQALIMNAEERLAAVLQQLPAPPDAVLVKQVIATTGGQMPECEGRELNALFGTNELSFEEVLDFYASNLEDTQWHLDLAMDRGRGFRIDDEFSLEISDLYEVSMVGQEAIQEGKSKFRTIYLLYLATSLELPLPPHCKGG